MRKLHAGGILLREWRGVQHQVTVLESGVLFRGEQYRSLSEVARVITGSRWSGPLFFGLKKRSRKESVIITAYDDGGLSGGNMAVATGLTHLRRAS